MLNHTWDIVILLNNSSGRFLLQHNFLLKGTYNNCTYMKTKITEKSGKCHNMN